MCQYHCQHFHFRLEMCILNNKTLAARPRTTVGIMRIKANVLINSPWAGTLSWQDMQDDLQTQLTSWSGQIDLVTGA